MRDETITDIEIKMLINNIINISKIDELNKVKKQIKTLENKAINKNYIFDNNLSKTNINNNDYFIIKNKVEILKYIFNTVVNELYKKDYSLYVNTRNDNYINTTYSILRVMSMKYDYNEYFNYDSINFNILNDYIENIHKDSIKTINTAIDTLIVSKNKKLLKNKNTIILKLKEYSESKEILYNFYKKKSNEKINEVKKSISLYIIDKIKNNEQNKIKDKIFDFVLKNVDIEQEIKMKNISMYGNNHPKIYINNYLNNIKYISLNSKIEIQDRLISYIFSIYVYYIEYVKSKNNDEKNALLIHLRIYYAYVHTYFISMYKNKIDNEEYVIDEHVKVLSKILKEDVLLKSIKKAKHIKGKYNNGYN